MSLCAFLLQYTCRLYSTTGEETWAAEWVSLVRGDPKISCYIMVVDHECLRIERCIVCNGEIILGVLHLIHTIFKVQPILTDSHRLHVLLQLFQ